jgi:hypothetical protein
MLGYDWLDVPFPLVQRIAAWQRDFDDMATPPEKADSRRCPARLFSVRCPAPNFRS